MYIPKFPGVAAAAGLGLPVKPSPEDKKPSSMESGSKLIQSSSNSGDSATVHHGLVIGSTSSAEVFSCSAVRMQVCMWGGGWGRGGEQTCRSMSPGVLQSPLLFCADTVSRKPQALMWLGESYLLLLSCLFHVMKRNNAIVSIAQQYTGIK